MRIGFFDTKEFESKDGRPSPFDETVVKRELIVMLNAIRSRYGRPIVINSGYRSPEHNKAVGGVANSQHVLGTAADIRPLSENMADLPELQSICDEMNPRGGVGFYDTFVHVDVRGERARWDNRTK